MRYKKLKLKVYQTWTNKKAINPRIQNLLVFKKYLNIFSKAPIIQIFWLISEKKNEEKAFNLINIVEKY